MRNLKTLFSILFTILFNVSFAQISIAYNPEQGPVTYFVSQFSVALLKEGENLVTFREQDQIGKHSIILVDKESIPSFLSSLLNAEDFREIKLEGYEHRWIDDGKTLLILYTDAVGAQYGLLDLTEHFQIHKTFKTLPDKLVNAGFEYRIVKINLPWSSYRTSEAMDMHTHVSRDLKFFGAVSGYDGLKPAECTFPLEQPSISLYDPVHQFSNGHSL